MVEPLSPSWTVPLPLTQKSRLPFLSLASPQPSDIVQVSFGLPFAEVCDNSGPLSVASKRWVPSALVTTEFSDPGLHGTGQFFSTVFPFALLRRMLYPPLPSGSHPIASWSFPAPLTPSSGSLVFFGSFVEGTCFGGSATNLQSQPSWSFA